MKGLYFEVKRSKVMVMTKYDQTKYMHGQKGGGVSGNGSLSSSIQFAALLHYKMLLNDINNQKLRFLGG